VLVDLEPLPVALCGAVLWLNARGARRALPVADDLALAAAA
jgi:hypothetical protein